MSHSAKPDRRDFVRAAAGASAGIALGGLAARSGQAQEDEPARNQRMIKVHHEWGALKEVVCGIPYLKIPETLPSCVYDYAPTAGIKFMEANPGKALEEADPETFERANKQMSDAIKILEERDIKIHRPKPVNDVEQAYLEKIFPASAIQFFPRDPMLVIGNRFIETELMLPVRRRERFGIRRALNKRLARSNAKVASMPPAVPAPEDDKGGFGPGPFIEGGDVFLLGEDIYVGVSGNASNAAGVRWLRKYLGRRYNVRQINLTKKFLHLDCCLATPRPGLAIICREAFVDGIPEFLDDWTLIDVPFKDAKEKLGCNGLVIDEDTIMIAEGLDYLAKGLRDAGQEVIETPFEAVYQYAGAFRCWHHPLYRESDFKEDDETKLG